MRQIRLLSGFVLGASLLAATSCVDSSFLDETSAGGTTREEVFGDSTLTSNFLNNIYEDIGFDIMPNRFGDGGLQTASDEAEYKITSSVNTDQQFATGVISAINCTPDPWSRCYRKIRAVNVFLAHADECPMDVDRREEYKAEAHFLRAWYYFLLLRHYGGVPLMGDRLYDNEDYTEIDMTRNTYEETVNYILDELATAEKVLPLRRSGVNFGRATKGMCMGLRSRMLLYGASKLHNGVTITDDARLKPLLGYPEANQDRWKDAADAAKELISTGQWQVYDRHMDNDGNEEPGWSCYAQYEATDFTQHNTYKDKTYTSGAYCGHIITINKGGGFEQEQCFNPPSCLGGGHGGYPNFDLVECFPMKDGAPIVNGASTGKYTYDRMNPGENRDPRFHNWFTWNNSKCYTINFQQNDVYTYKGVGSTTDAIGQATRTGYYFRKMCYRANLFGSPQSYCVMRYEEILLNWAEAVNEFYGPNHEEAMGQKAMSPYTVLYAIREKAGIEPGEDGTYGIKQGMSQDEMREAIRLERRIELMVEGHRFYDVRRWQIAEQTDNGIIHGWEITRKLDGSITARVINVRQRVFRPAMYFWPIPYDEVTRSQGTLLQNPYYE